MQPWQLFPADNRGAKIMNILKAVGPSSQGKLIMWRFKHIEPSCCRRCCYSFKEARILNLKGKQKKPGRWSFACTSWFCFYDETIKILPLIWTPPPRKNPLGVAAVNVQPPSSKSIPQGPLVMLKLYPLDLSPLPGGAKWTFVMDGAAGALREEGACLPGSGGFSSLLVPAAHGTFCGTHLSEFGGTFPGVPRKFCQSPNQLPEKYSRFLMHWPVPQLDLRGWFIASFIITLLNRRFQ